MRAFARIIGGCLAALAGLMVLDARSVAAAGEGLTLSDAWVPAAPEVGRDIPLLLTIKNETSAPEALMRVRCPIANFSERHTVDRGEGAPAMRSIPNIPVPAGSTLVLLPTAYHVMLLQTREPLEPGKRALVLARVLQGACAVKDRRTVLQALEELYRCETTARPFGQGIIGASVVASLDVLEALWPQLDQREKASLNAMLEALRFLHAKANTIGFLVERPEDIEGLIQAMGQGTLIEQRNAGRAIIRHPSFHAVICLGRSITEAASATALAVEEHGARWLIMPGQAHALGEALRHVSGGPHFSGAGPGALVIASSVAPFGIKSELQDALSVAEAPFSDGRSAIIPADPALHRLAHDAAETMLDEIGQFFEGQTVTRKGDCSDDAVLAAFPGALGADES
ncbi:MAG: copper chaperone PCu(A)C, partial [Bradyrhizobium sp.]|nr:copper chaperone PCu(A)C [Bradyrhizobium sp.]